MGVQIERLRAELAKARFVARNMDNVVTIGDLALGVERVDAEIAERAAAEAVAAIERRDADALDAVVSPLAGALVRREPKTEAPPAPKPAKKRVAKGKRKGARKRR
jgi:hypothetical protein